VTVDCDVMLNPNPSSKIENRLKEKLKLKLKLKET